MMPPAGGYGGLNCQCSIDIMPHRAYLGLGSNLGNRSDNLDRSIAALRQKVGALVKCSSYICTNPWGFCSGNQFFNAVALFETSLSPTALLCATQQIERQLGRTAKSRDGIYADRVIDIDILFYDNLVLSTPELQIPHPLIPQRDFVLRPLAEIAPRKQHPLLHKTVARLLKELRAEGVVED